MRSLLTAAAISMAFTLFLTPVAYLLRAGLSKPRAEESKRLEAELARAGAAAQTR